MFKLFPAFNPRLDWIQVAVTSRCTAQCVYCPRTVLRRQWKNLDMDFQVFSDFISGISGVNLIYLQGWGEPFVHPRFWDMLALVKKKGFLAGCTSNAGMLDSDSLEKAVDYGLDIIAFSLAGIGENNDRTRKATSYKQVRWAAEKLGEIKARKNSPVPAVHLAYMVLRSGLDDLKGLSSVILDSGIDHAVLSTLSLPLDRKLEMEAVIADSPEEYRDIKSWISSLFSGPKLCDKVFAHFYNPFAGPGTCTENVQRALCLSPEGRVSPCVMTQVPAKPPAGYMFKGTWRPLEQVDFGNITRQKLKHIWHSQRYRRFRRNPDLQQCSWCTLNRIDSTLCPD
ncbi:MAG: radical SAM/SPASM domain-containing protein [Desulfosalsimonas sp.]